MPQDKSFRFALLISIVIHGALFLNTSGLRFLSPKPQEKNIEVNYLKIKPVDSQDTKQMVIRHNPSATQIKKLPPLFIKKEEIFKESIKKSLLVKPALPKPDIISVKKIIQLKPIEIEKINNPVYISYYQMVREKIKRCAYQNYVHSDTGQVYLTFVILSNGMLDDVRLNEEKSSANNYLKKIALKSIRDACPFLPFPKELDYPQLSFNVIISFEIE